MNKYGGLLEKIAEQLDIVRGFDESENDWKARTIYSAIGHLTIASLFDLQKGKDSISITHFRRRVSELFDSYKSMYPEVKVLFENQADDLAKEFYHVMLRTGCLYHSSKRITAPTYSCGTDGETLFVRGNPLKEAVFRSGLGAYTRLSLECKCGSISSMYGITEDSLPEQWSQFTRSITWVSRHLPSRPEYLRISPKRCMGYFKDHPDKDGRISLLRIRQQKRYSYYFYKHNGEEILISMLPLWMTDQGEWRRIANCCIFSRGTLPKTEFQVDGDIVYITIRYLYPPAEQNLIRLYSWPKSFECHSDKSHRKHFGSFNRVLSKSVFFAIKNGFEQIGYQFTEE